MNVRYVLKWLRYQHFWRFVYRPVKPYDTGIYLYFGLPRSGKSTYAAKLAKKALTAGRVVYSNFPIRGTFQITKDDIGKYLMEDCLIIIDEAGVDFDNRKMKMTDEQVYFFKNHGHYQADIAFFSQSTDVDIKIRKLAVCHYEIKRFPLIRDLSYIKTIGRKIGIDDLTHQETEMFYYVHFSPVASSSFGAGRITSSLIPATGMSFPPRRSRNADLCRCFVRRLPLQDFSRIVVHPVLDGSYPLFADL